MEKEFKIGKAIFKFYDLFFFMALILGAIFVATLDGISNEINIPSNIAAATIIGIELVYIFTVINKRSKKKK